MCLKSLQYVNFKAYNRRNSRRFNKQPKIQYSQDCAKLLASSCFTVTSVLSLGETSYLKYMIFFQNIYYFSSFITYVTYSKR